MVCIYCSKSTGVINSRPQKRLNRVWRRRGCKSCGAVFTTVEELAPSGALAVNKDGKIEPFARDKLFLSIYKSLAHRASATADASALTDTCLSKITRTNRHGIIALGELKQTVHEVLTNFDTAAAVSYQAYHQAS